MTEFNLAIADKYQLKYWAKEEYDLGLSLSMSAETMRARILAHCAKNEIETPNSVVKGKTLENVKYVTINIAKSDKKDGGTPVFVGVQGVSYLIPRGIPIDVPPSVVEVLNNAITDVVTQDPDSGEMLHEDVATYPFQILNNPNPMAA